MLGGAGRAEEVPEAEPLLLEGYSGMKAREQQISPAGKPRLTEALERLVQLYDPAAPGGQARPGGSFQMLVMHAANTRLR